MLSSAVESIVSKSSVPPLAVDSITTTKSSMLPSAVDNISTLNASMLPLGQEKKKKHVLRAKRFQKAVSW